MSLLAMAGLISAYGAWKGQKWGIALTMFLEAADARLMLLGVLPAPSEYARISAMPGVVIAVFAVFGLMQSPPSV
jgi:hypothetical protein